MAEQKQESPSQVALRDPLEEVTRNQRRSLLAASGIGIAIAWTGLVPTEISTLGIKFSQTEQSTLLFFIGVVVLYFLVAFLLYATSDIVAWRLAYGAAEMKSFAEFREKVEEAELEGRSDDVEEYYRDRWGTGFRFLPFLVRPASLVRAIFDFLVPIAVGIYAIGVLLFGWF